jgi:solute carrier family 25 phosphate transporter 23/24/25/41
MWKKWTTHNAGELGRLEGLFKKLDMNSDGVVDKYDFIRAQYKLNLHLFPGQTLAYFHKYDHDDDGKIDYFDFINYYIEHEKLLKWSFDRIDYNKDGYIDAEDIEESFDALEVEISRAEAEALVRRITRGRGVQISWPEWRDFHVLNPYVGDTQDVVRYWRDSMKINLGEYLLGADDQEPEGKWWRLLVAGGVAGGCSRTVTAPLDRIKVMLQVHGHTQKHLGISTCLQKMLQEGGVRSLWRGNGINVLKITPEMAIRFCAYENIKQRWVGPGNEPTLLDRLVCGSLAGGIAQTVIYPMETLKTRLVLRTTGQYKGILDCAAMMLVNEGAKTFYRGYVPNLLGIIPYCGIDLAVYETLKEKYERTYNTEATDCMNATFAAISTSLGQLCTYPLALIRTKLQAQTTAVRQSPMAIFSHIMVTDGLKGLWRGIAPNMLKATPAMSVNYVIYERMRKRLNIPSKKRPKVRTFQDFGTFCPKKVEEPRSFDLLKWKK